VYEYFQIATIGYASNPAQTQKAAARLRQAGKTAALQISA
jgi:hypothetical protein